MAGRKEASFEETFQESLALLNDELDDEISKLLSSRELSTQAPSDLLTLTPKMNSLGEAVTTNTRTPYTKPRSYSEKIEAAVKSVRRVSIPLHDEFLYPKLLPLNRRFPKDHQISVDDYMDAYGVKPVLRKASRRIYPLLIGLSLCMGIYYGSTVIAPLHQASLQGQDPATSLLKSNGGLHGGIHAGGPTAGPFLHKLSIGDTAFHKLLLWSRPFTVSSGVRVIEEVESHPEGDIRLEQHHPQNTPKAEQQAVNIASMEEVQGQSSKIQNQKQQESKDASAVITPASKNEETLPETTEVVGVTAVKVDDTPEIKTSSTEVSQQQKRQQAHAPPEQEVSSVILPNAQPNLDTQQLKEDLHLDEKELQQLQDSGRGEPQKPQNVGEKPRQSTGVQNPKQQENPKARPVTVITSGADMLPEKGQTSTGTEELDMNGASKVKESSTKLTPRQQQQQQQQQQEEHQTSGIMLPDGSDGGSMDAPKDGAREKSHPTTRWR